MRIGRKDVADPDSARVQARRGKKADTIQDAYDDSDRGMAVEDAHRDAVYQVPSDLSQIWTCYMTQMKRFTKERTVWLIIILLVMIPVAFVAMGFMKLTFGHITNIFICTLLAALPVMVPFLSANVCGAMLPREFNERTAYLSIPLPMSRFSFYIGKYLAGFTLVLGTITAAYGVSIMVALVMGTDATYTPPLFISLLTTICAVFFYTAFTYMFSASSRRGATMKSLLVLLVALPAVVLGLGFASNVEQLASFRFVLEPLADVFGYLPVCAPDLALGHLGTSALYPVMHINGFSLFQFANSVTPMVVFDMNAYVLMVVSVVLGVLCLLRGYLRVKRRDM